jgi:hypothetical protein
MRIAQQDDSSIAFLGCISRLRHKLESLCYEAYLKATVKPLQF